MQSGWVRWIAYFVLAALVVVTASQAGAAPAPVAVAAPSGAAG
ncbi:MAG TPA: hypothetical protein VFJ13_10410 [Paracoccaceae bacterium]|nr:hypothetical protein [Paracoccaceae bacterium]